MKFLLYFFLTFYTSLLAQCNKVDTSRFSILDDKVFDKKTQLIWMRCSIGSKWKDNIGCDQIPNTMSYHEAKDVKNSLNNGWRIPTIEELKTIFIDQCEHSALNSKLFPDIKLLDNFAPYWSSTPVEQMPSLIYYIDFIDKKLDAHSKGFSMFLRLVKTKSLSKNE